MPYRAGWSLAYSGDCRPSRQLAAAARGVQVMIHEATFEDDLADHAVSKRHSTSGEALAVAGEAAAGCTILTHFSQRYPKAVGTGMVTGTGTGTGTEGSTGVSDGANLDNPDAASVPSANAVITAFDGMRVRWDRLRHLSAVMSRVNAMFLAHEERASGKNEGARHLDELHDSEQT